VRRLLAFISLVVFVDTMLFGVMIPLLPGYADSFELSKLQAGILFGAYGAGAVLGGLPGGMIAARVGPRRAVLAGLLREGEEARICALLEYLGFNLWHPALGKTGANGEWTILEGLRDFQEHLGGELTITLLGGIGVGVEVHEIDRERMRQAMVWLKERAGD